MKKLFVCFLTLAMILSIAACGGSPGGDAATAGIVVGLSADVSALDPQLSNELGSVAVYGNMFDTLVLMDENHDIVPHIAKSWEQTDDLTTVFHLRDDITFSNGDKLTAEDVVFTIDRVINSYYVAYSLDFVDYAEALDEYTVAVHTKEPFGPIMAHFTIPYTGIVPKSAVEADESAFSLNPIGSGAYELVSWNPGDSIIFKANENYFLGAPEVKELTFKIMPENSQRLIALENGEIDIAYDISPNDISKIEKDDSLKVLNEESMACMMLTINTAKDGSLSDVRVRQALELAVDKQALADAVAYGYGSPAAIIIPPICVGYSDIQKPIGQNLEAAKALLAEAGYADGFTCKLWTSDDTLRIEACNIIQNQLDQINVTADIEILEYGSLLSRLNDGEHDLIYERWTTDSCDAYYTLYGMYDSSCTAYEGNDAFYNNPEVDRLLAEARTKFDEKDRLKVYEEIYKIIAADTPYITTYYPFTSVAMKSNINGFRINPSGANQIRLLTIG